MYPLKKQCIYIFLFLAIFLSCQNQKSSPTPFAHIKNEKVKTLISKAITAAGGLENWKQLQSLDFKKYFALYDSLGNTENAVHQTHRYVFNPEKEIHISWEKENALYRIQSKNEQTTKTINGKTDPAAKSSSLLNTVRSATFVLSIPFNLLDAGVAFQHKGFDTLEDGQEVEVLQADYNPTTHNNHSTKDTWWLYFDKNNFQLVGYMVQHADHFSYVKNLSTENVSGFIFPKKRKSWRVTPQRKILFLRADYDYTNYSINEKKSEKMISIIQTPSPNLNSSLDFYKRLNFQVLSENEPTLVTDGKTVIEINPNKYARAGIQLYKKSWTEEVEKLKEMTNVMTIDNGYLLSDPSNTWIYLMEGEPKVSIDLENIQPSTLGNFAGMSLETTDIQGSINLWKVLGFSKTMGGIEQGWVLFSHENGTGVSFMQPNSCPHLFFSPSLTYFNGKNNLKVIEEIRKAEIPITQEITEFNKEGIVDNVIIRDPGGYGFFIFSD